MNNNLQYYRDQLNILKKDKKRLSYIIAEHKAKIEFAEEVRKTVCKIVCNDNVKEIYLNFKFGILIFCESNKDKLLSDLQNYYDKVYLDNGAILIPFIN